VETRANYILVGIVTIAVLLASFGFVYWIARGGESQNMVPLEVRIPGSVTGLTVGSQVLFNGIKVGDVRRMQIDPENPAVVIVVTQVDRTTPITPKTVATLGFQGLTGQAYIELKGGDLRQQNLLEAAEKTGEVARIEADPGAVNNLIDKAQQIATRADKVLISLEQFVNDNQQPLTQSIANVRGFTEALSKNSQNIDEFLVNVGELSKTLKGVSTRLDTTLASAEDLLRSVDKKKIDSVLANADKISADLAKSSGEIEKLVAGVQDGVKKFGEFSATASKTIESVDKLVSAADAAKVKTTIDNIEAASKTARTAVDDVSAFTGKFRDKDGGLLGDGSAGEGLVADARATLGSFRKVADTLNSRLGEITDGLAKFSGRGLSDIQGAVQDSRRSISRIESAISNLERNPQRLIFGGTDSVPRSDGRNRR
jgi:phospholipid/cholesterol/gamma-HCH transport system substrate-binding protein